MKALRFFLFASAVLLSALALSAQQPRPTEPGTASPQVSPASAAPQTQPNPNLRTDSKPHTDLSPSTDSSPPPENLGMDATSFLDLGYDFGTPTIPAGMQGSIPSDNPSLVFLSLAHRPEAEIAPQDAALIATRRQELERVAHSRGYDLKRDGWSYEQVVCPASDPAAVLLQFARHTDRRQYFFTAVVPRDAASVRVLPVLHGKPILPEHYSDKGQKELPLIKSKQARVVNEALPPPTLFAHLEPRQDWLATSACIAELDGAHPRIPVLPEIDNEMTTGPAPLLRLLLDGERKVTFTDQQADDRISVWDEWVTRKGKLQMAEQWTWRLTPRPITNPPVPAPITIANIPQPPVRMLPAPPSPLSGEQQ